MAVPRFEPFRATRYAADLPLDDVTAPPYDVLSADDVARLAARHPRNIVRVDVPGPDDDHERYEHAAQRLTAWRDEGTLVVDPLPSFTIYRMAFRTPDGRRRETVGVLGALEVVDEGAGGVLPHERTTPKAKTDRLDLTRTTGANLSPVWGLSLAAGLTQQLAAAGTLVGECTDEHGVVHRAERVDEPERVAEIAGLVGSAPVLIADGHHRYAISRTYRDERRALDGPGAWDLTLSYVGELVEDQLSIDAIHRVYPATAAEALLATFADAFDTEPAGAIDEQTGPELVRRGALCLVHPDGTGTFLTPRPDRFAGVRALDGALLEHALASADVDVTYQHGISEVVELVRSGRAGSAVLIRPTGIDEIRRTADEGLLMPPKSTFFTPKLRTGLVVRSFGD